MIAGLSFAYDGPREQETEGSSTPEGSGARPHFAEEVSAENNKDAKIEQDIVAAPKCFEDRPKPQQNELEEVNLSDVAEPP